MQIVELAREQIGDVRGLYYAPRIPEPIERAVRAVHAETLPASEQVLLLYDDTLFGGADDGFVLTARRLCWKALGESPLSLTWNAVEPRDVRCEHEQVFIAAGKLPLTAWDHVLAQRLSELLRAIAAASQSVSYRDAAPRCEPLVEDAVLALARRHLGGAKRLFLRPEIPARKELGARTVHARHLPPTEPILVLYDDTLWGSGRDGFVITPTRLCWKAFLEGTNHVFWHRLAPASVKVCGREIHVAGATLSVSAQHCRAGDVANLLVAIAAGLASASGCIESAR